MPDRAVSVLIVSVTDVLDRSKAGKDAAQALEARFKAAKEKRASIADGVEAARYEIDVVREIEGERNRLREELLVKARKAAEALRKEKGASVVLDRGQTLAADATLDVTDELIRRIDRG